MRADRYKKMDPFHKREYRRVQKHKKRAKDAGLPNSLTLTEWRETLDKFELACAFCEKSGPLTLEHLVPIRMGGGTTKENCVPACESCNGGLHDSAVLGVN